MIVIVTLAIVGHIIAILAYRNEDPLKMRIAYYFFLAIFIVAILHCNIIWMLVYGFLIYEAARLIKLYVSSH